MHAPLARAFLGGKEMYKTFYLSINGGETYRRVTKDERHFKRMMWDICMKALYPEGVIHTYGDPLSLTIREPKQMSDNHTYYVHESFTSDDVWKMINKMWDYISSKC